ncbi:MAG: Glycosyl transferase family 2 [Candidatus Woesebacteria bacterium GW2011_GWB1_39_10b]|uniref:Glycosyl transferase family 2 n=2 Tax=Candidatus Woeseibacteriota TaxID=1752722 RepID=A0A0G0RCQ7_9BACT|nr:MAG: Glycosyl transferase family 2 [Candidatus Woesebacteria bacterium GW2011_GWB1_39_10b]KKR11487.1 MAG: Glycosyl transferase family 2 [Candidatus Woesebacteria bacterium GW2011_GWA1_39_21b]KKS89671.1 MAG: Glycosyl transferase family 2 [Parcubacteria group bacterium GW2011_GWC1_43_11b]
MDLKYTGERQIPATPGTIEGIDIKHIERYKWASVFTYNKRVYDIACGVGYGSLLLKAGEYSGYDNSQETIEYAKEYYSKKLKVKFFAADAYNMPDLPVADVVVSFETIEHLEKPDAFLAWCSHHGEILVISSPIKNSFARSKFHLFEYRLNEFSEALKKHFSNIEMFIQKNDLGIIYPCKKPDDKGVAIAICQR